MNTYNILYLHETAELGGAEHSLFNLLKKIDRAKFNPIFVCSGQGPFTDKLIKFGIQVEFVEFFPLRKIIGVIPALRRIRQIIRRANIDLVHSNSIRTHIYAIIAGRLEKKNVVWHERNLIDRELLDINSILSFLPDKILCNSQAIARRFLKKGKLPNKVAVIYNGVDTDLFNPELSGEEIKREFNLDPEWPIIGIASRFNRAKGHEIFFKAAKIILNNIPHCRFLVSGGAVFKEDCLREEYLRKLAGDLGIGGKVIFTGFREEMPKIYAATDIFVLASEAEPCGRVILEAMACGKPVVGTATGGTPEMITDGATGILIPPKDPFAMAAAIGSLLIDPDKARQMGNAGRQRVKNSFNIERNVTQIQNTYLQLLEEGQDE